MGGRQGSPQSVPERGGPPGQVLPLSPLWSHDSEGSERSPHSPQHSTCPVWGQRGVSGARTPGAVTALLVAWVRPTCDETKAVSLSIQGPTGTQRGSLKNDRKQTFQQTTQVPRAAQRPTLGNRTLAVRRRLPQALHRPVPISSRQRRPPAVQTGRDAAWREGGLSYNRPQRCPFDPTRGVPLLPPGNFRTLPLVAAASVSSQRAGGLLSTGSARARVGGQTHSVSQSLGVLT